MCLKSRAFGLSVDHVGNFINLIVVLASFL